MTKSKFHALSSLLETTIHICKTYRPSRQTPDSFLQSYLLEHPVSQSYVSLLEQMFFGLLQYKPFLQAVLKNLCSSSPSLSSAHDRLQFEVISYLILFRFQEIEFSDFKNLVSGVPKYKMIPYLEYIVNTDKLAQVIFPEAAEFLEQEYIKKVIFGNIKGASQKLTTLLAQASIEATGKISAMILDLCGDGVFEPAQKKKQPTTVPEPFNLTTPKKMVIPEPIKISTSFKAQPVPKNGSLSLEQLYNQKAQRLDTKIEENCSKYRKPLNVRLPIQPIASKSTSNTPSVQQPKMLLNQRQSLPKLTHFPASIYSSSPQIVPNPTFNSILKQEQLIKKMEQAEISRIQTLQKGLRNSDQFKRYRELVMAEDSRMSLEKNVLRKAEIEVLRENISQLPDRLKNSNLKKISQFKQELQELRKQHSLSLLEQQKKIRNLKADIDQCHRNAQMEKQKVLKENKVIRNEIVQEKKEFKRLALHNSMVEMDKKKRLIEQIKELDERLRQCKQVGRRPQSPQKSHGLLQEMNIQELRIRLGNRKQEIKQAEEIKRSLILRDKRQRDQSIEQKKQRLKQHHSAISLKRQQIKQAQLKRKDEQKRTIQARLKQAQEEFLQKQQKLAKERDRIKEELRRANIQKGFQRAWSQHAQLAAQNIQQPDKTKKEKLRLDRTGRDIHKSVHIESNPMMI